MKALLLVLMAVATLAGCDSRAAQVEKCVAANVHAGRTEGDSRLGCMRAAYGNNL